MRGFRVTGFLELNRWPLPYGCGSVQLHLGIVCFHESTREPRTMSLAGYKKQTLVIAGSVASQSHRHPTRTRSVLIRPKF